ncbi:MAG: hypothetical protein ABIQ59_01320 [Nocardioidaceae bacterium]
MRPELQAIASRTAGVFRRGDAVLCGYTERELKTHTGHGGDWVVVRRGCYAERAVWDGLDDEGRYELTVRAALLVQTRRALPSHASAAVLLGLPTRPFWRRLVHVTRPGVTGSRTENGVKHHLAGYDARDLGTAGELDTLGLARTAVDLGREHGFEDGVVAADAALRMGVTGAELWRAIERMTFWPQVTRARAALRVADGGAQNIGETLLRLMVLELDIGVPETQYVVREGSRWAAVDVRVGRHLFEFDGRVKYLEREQGGVADRPVTQVLWDEKQREDWLRRAQGGHGMSRVVWSELFGTERRRTLRRLAQEYAQTRSRFGREAG